MSSVLAVVENCARARMVLPTGVLIPPVLARLMIRPAVRRKAASGARILVLPAVGARRQQLSDNDEALARQGRTWCNYSTV